MSNGASANGRESRAEVYLTALQSLSKIEREAVITRILEDPELLEEVIDIALMKERQGDESRPFEEYLAERNSGTRGE